MAGQQDRSTMAPSEMLADAIWGRGNYRIVEAFGEEYVITRPGWSVVESESGDDA
jgi:hypothetical protein